MVDEMITYICRSKDEKTGEDLPCNGNYCQTSICPSCGGRAEAESQIYWCSKCRVPLYDEHCSICGSRGKRIAADIRPVFPEERLLIELVLGKPFAFAEKSVWNGSGNHYFVDGEKINFSVKELKKLDREKLRQAYEKQKEQNSDAYSRELTARFAEANRERYEHITEEAKSYIRKTAEGFGTMDMFVSFSGGKDSTVTSDLVTKALSSPQIMHIFGDTTLEFPFTYQYVRRLRNA